MTNSNDGILIIGGTSDIGRENHLATAAQSNADFAADVAGTPDDEDSVGAVGH